MKLQMRGSLCCELKLLDEAQFVRLKVAFSHLGLI